MKKFVAKFIWALFLISISPVILFAIMCMALGSLVSWSYQEALAE